MMRAAFDFTGARVLVTGAAGGIGRAVAEGFAHAGAEVTLLDLHPDVEAVARELSGTARWIGCDIADRTAVRAALGDFGRLDVLVNNAGFEHQTPLGDPPSGVDGIFDRIVEVNIGGTGNVTRTVLPGIPDGGRILLTSSIWGRTAVPEFDAYAASKHAVIGLMRTWARELGPRGIRVNAICPGWVRTGQAMGSLARMAAAQGRSMTELEAEIPRAQALPGLMEPADVAGLYLFLASDAAANITGQAINIDRGEVMS